jgi:hypothetical protein
MSVSGDCARGWNKRNTAARIAASRFSVRRADLPQRRFSVKPIHAAAVATTAIATSVLVAAANPDLTIVKYNDGAPDGKKSLGGSGEIIDFQRPAGKPRVSGLRIHGARYGQPQPPDEKFLVSFSSPTSPKS